MMCRRTNIPGILPLLLKVAGVACAVLLAEGAAGAAHGLRASNTQRELVSRAISTNQPAWYGAVYAERKGLRLLGRTSFSEDNGRTWAPFTWRPDFSATLPYGYRRDPITGVCDPRSGRLIVLFNALDTPGLDPKAHEPAIAQRTYYLRYRVSNDGGRTWLFDEPIIQAGAFEARHPIDGVWVGTNAIYLGDLGCIPIVTRSGTILVPTQMTPLGPDGTLWNPSGGHTFTDVRVLSGIWTPQARLNWTVSEPVRGDPKRTTRGLIDPRIDRADPGRVPKTRHPHGNAREQRRRE